MGIRRGSMGYEVSGGDFRGGQGIMCLSLKVLGGI